MRNFKSRKAFTLVEVMVSIVLLGLIFTFLYSTINSVKKRNANYLEKSEIIKKEERIFVLFNLDFAQAMGKISITNGTRFDVVKFRTRHSIYGILEPHVVYLVSKKDKALVRLESLKSFDLDNKDQLSRVFMYGDIVVKDCVSFKISHKDSLINLLFRSKELKPMVLRIPTAS
ncbi:MAG: type II secretion system protein [Sulfurimonas sp.]|nr:type II secretion system protein [Sulfurimonas sp.]